MEVGGGGKEGEGGEEEEGGEEGGRVGGQRGGEEGGRGEEGGEEEEGGGVGRVLAILVELAKDFLSIVVEATVNSCMFLYSVSLMIIIS